MFSVTPLRFCSLCSTPILRKNTFEGSQEPLSSSTNLTRGLATRRLFRVPPFCESTVYLQTSMPSPGFEPSPNGTAVSFANHYTGWAAALHSTIKKSKLIDWIASLIEFPDKFLAHYS
ncbi:hypothetical protein TNCV_4443671 [Trichonephila clavipes]|nr:hypothetical protein TNCV_4443671 [Trichonephila clavipes]